MNGFPPDVSDLVMLVQDLHVIVWLIPQSSPYSNLTLLLTRNWSKRSFKSSHHGIPGLTYALL